MELIDSLQLLASRIDSLLPRIQTEEATKNTLIMPMLNALGYDVFNPSEVVPEFTADVGTKKGEKVDYAIFIDGKLTLLIECKAVGATLSLVNASQLYRYFSVTDARFAVLTDGLLYKFYTDLDSPNRMDEKPFFEFDLRDHDTRDITELRKFSKSLFHLDNILSTASELKYTQQIQRLLSDEFKNPARPQNLWVDTVSYRHQWPKRDGSAHSASTRDFFRIAVETAVAGRPPHRSVLERLTHTAPALSRARNRTLGNGWTIWGRGRWRAVIRAKRAQLIR